MTNTPGYNCRIGIRITTTKGGQEQAHYWSMKAFRWFRIKLSDAEYLLATDAADRLAPVSRQTAA